MHTSETFSNCADQILTAVPIIVRGLWNRLQPEMSRATTWSQFGLLSLLNDQSLTLTELAREWGVTKPSMSKMVSMLVERGWITREKDPADHRRKPLRLTPAGCDVYERVRATVVQNLAQSLESLDDDQCIQIVSALNMLVTSLS